MLTQEEIAERFQQIQSDICAALEAADGKGTFIKDHWEREEGGGGLSRVMMHGNVIEKGGVNFSAVHGEIPGFLKKEGRNANATSFFATGVSIVIHPTNPHVPIIHMNIRYFQMDNGEYWFGGGIDLTPIYVVDDQATFFHQQMKAVCDQHHPSYYDAFKKWADEYFYIPHRNETRGVGGIFFDHLQPKAGQTKKDLFEFVCDVGETFAPTYSSLIQRNKEQAYTDDQKKWQLIRRGRYVEFNLVYDRGTKFGLQTNGRIESILMSLPEHASWVYNFQPDPNSPEAITLSKLRQGINWV